jgi:hypothetical protein
VEDNKELIRSAWMWLVDMFRMMDELEMPQTNKAVLGRYTSIDYRRCYDYLDVIKLKMLVYLFWNN